MGPGGPVRQRRWRRLLPPLWVTTRGGRVISRGPNRHPRGFNGTFSWAARQVAYKISEVCRVSLWPLGFVSTVAAFRCPSLLRLPAALRWVQFSLRQRLATGLFALDVDQFGDRHLQLLGQLEERLQAGVPLPTLETRQQSEGEGRFGEVLLGHCGCPACLANGIPDPPKKTDKIHAPSGLE